MIVCIPRHAVPPTFKERVFPQEQLIACLLGAGTNANPTSVTAPKSRSVSSQGMVSCLSLWSCDCVALIVVDLYQGGVGKTMLTSAVVRDIRVRAAFEVIGWVNLSQQPDLLELQRRLYQQLRLEKESMPTKSKESVEMQAAALKEAATGKVVLIVLDDIWDSNHSKPFIVIDESNPSR